MAKLVVTDREGNVQDVEGTTGMSLMENIRDLDNSVEAICGGMCSCATCHCLIEPDWLAKLPAPSPDELDLLEELESFNPERSRLSCQVPFTDELDGLVLTVGPEE
jgi:2Fe-2S ferredoxin